MRALIQRLRRWQENLHREALAIQGERLALRVVELCKAGHFEEAVTIEREELNPIQRELGAPESKYAPTDPS